jgi:cob(I)alamin adenosyltransferase
VTKIVIDDSSIARLEGWIDHLEGELPPLRHFILAGGALPGAALHVARTVCRRAERATLLLGADSIEPVVLVYLNRLSDLLFVMARAANRRSAVPETEW